MLASLIANLEATKPKAGLVDPATDFAVCRQFALSVYARADRNDVNASGTSNAPPTRTQVEAFSAAGTFLKALAHFGALDADLERRQQYAEWRAWDLATAMHAGRQPSPVNGHGGGSSPKETRGGIDAFTPPPPAAPRSPPAPERPAVSVESRFESLAVEIEQALLDDERTAPYTRSAFAERVTGGHFVDFDIDRFAAARHGLTVADIQAVVASAIGGMNVSVVYRRYEG